jgi:hypothetical protein
MRRRARVALRWLWALAGWLYWYLLLLLIFAAVLVITLLATRR